MVHFDNKTQIGINVNSVFDVRRHYSVVDLQRQRSEKTSSKLDRVVFIIAISIIQAHIDVIRCYNYNECNLISLINVIISGWRSSSIN